MNIESRAAAAPIAKRDARFGEKSASVEAYVKEELQVPLSSSESCELRVPLWFKPRGCCLLKKPGSE